MVKFTPSAGLFGGEITRELPEITRDYPRLTESRKAGLFGGELAVRRADEAARLGGGAALADGAPFSARPLATGSPLNLLGTFLQAPGARCVFVGSVTGNDNTVGGAGP